MELEHFRDFDAELEAKPERGFRLGGRDYTLPREMPAAAMLAMQRARLARAQDDSEADVLAPIRAMLDSLLGDGTTDQMLSDGVGFDRLSDLSDYILTSFNLKRGEGQGEATKATRETTGSPASSATGPSSPPTGEASTAPASATTSTPSPGGSSPT